MPESKLKRAAAAVARTARRVVGRPKVIHVDSPTLPPSAEPLDVTGARSAVERQLAFEKTHPVPYAPDQRWKALKQRFTLASGRAPSPREEAEIREWFDTMTKG